MRTPTSKKSWVRREFIAIGVSVGLLVVPVLGPWQSQARAEKGAITNAICSLLGDIAWHAYFAKNYTLLAEVDQTMEAVGCFE